MAKGGRQGPRGPLDSRHLFFSGVGFMNAFRPGRRAAATFLLSVSIAIGGADAGAADVVSSAGARDLADVARGLPRGATLRIDGLALDGTTDVVGLDLVRFEVVAPGAAFVVQSDDGPRLAKPDVPTYLRGTVDGRSGAVVVLSVRGDGEIRGIVSARDATWMLERKTSGSGGLASGRVDFASKPRPSFDCEVLDNPNPPRPAPSPEALERVKRLPIAYTASIAVELDYDYYLTFAPNVDAALVYALDLIAYTGVLGEAELGMNTLVPFIQLWVTSKDPYSGGNGRLQQLLSRWNTAGSDFCGGSDCTTIQRSTVILLSSAPTGGVAYVPGLCDSFHSPTNGYAYAYAGSIAGNFDVHSPSTVWDIVVTTHELGHNFGTHHTHCYSPTVDECYGSEGGCYAGATSLPSGCPGAGQNCGTIMSYCHLLSGGINNVALSYGAGHPYGTDPDRVPTAMIAQIASEYAAAPACLAPVTGMTELEIVKAGNGHGTVTSSPTGVNCGSACRTYFDGDTVVTLTATPGTFADFDGWTGDPDCSDGVVTLSAATSCTATFTGNCGAGNDDCEDDDPCTQDSCPMDDHCENAAEPIDASSCFEGGSVKLQIKDSAVDKGDKIVWSFAKGDEFVQADLGSPVLDTGYDLCVYDSSAMSYSLATSLHVTPSSAWANKDPKGWNYNDKTASSDGVKKLQLKPGAAGKSKVKLIAQGLSLPLPAAFSMTELFDQDPDVVVQLLNDEGMCWTSAFTPARTSKNTPALFKAVGP